MKQLKSEFEARFTDKIGNVVQILNKSYFIKINMWINEAADVLNCNKVPLQTKIIKFHKNFVLKDKYVQVPETFEHEQLWIKICVNRNTTKTISHKTVCIVELYIKTLAP